MSTQRRVFWSMLAAAAWVVPGGAATAVEGTFTIPYITGRPGQQPFARAGWVDAYASGNSTGVSARIGPDGKFKLPEPGKSVCLIAMFDRMETPPVVLPGWPAKDGVFDARITCAYALR